MGLAGGEEAERLPSGKPPPALSLSPARGSPRSRAAESGDAELDLPSPFLFVNRRRGCLCPGSFSLLLSGSLVPPARAAAAFSDAAAPPQLFALLGSSEVGLNFDLFKFSMCANTHIFLYGQRGGNPSLQDGRFPNAGTWEPRPGSPELMFA